jgi:N-hydroxyarylamine O-acetyltransferase
MLSGRVFGPGGPGREFAHMLLLVNAGASLAADVGFGDSFVEPIPLGGDGQGQPGHSYRVVERSEGWRLERRLPGSDWEPQYAFTTTPHALDAFRPMCDYHQTSPDSTFTRKSVCSRATPAGRVTLANGRLIVTSDGRRQERMVATTEEYRALLEAHFRIDLGEEAEKAMKPALGTASGAPGDDG